MRASYLFVNHPSQAQTAGGAMESNSFSNTNPMTSANFGNSNISLAFLQSLAGQQQAQQQLSYQRTNPLQSQFQLQAQLQRQQVTPQMRSNQGFFQLQQQPTLNANLLSTLMNAQNVTVANSEQRK